MCRRDRIISRINGFTYVQTEFDYFTGELKVVRELAYSDGPRAKVKCYGADDVREGVAVSYTHLDVYKRQAPTAPTRKATASQEWWQGYEEADVYKRQGKRTYPIKKATIARWLSIY